MITSPIPHARKDSTMLRFCPLILLLSFLPSLCPAEEYSFGDKATVTDKPIAPDGTQVQCDLPRKLHLRNTGGSDGPRGPGSGSGLCVFTSLNHAAFWHNHQFLFDFQKWCMQRPGGGYPAKVDKYMDEISKEKGVPKPRYIQIESRNLDILRKGLKSGRMVSITYYRSPTLRYGGSTISHMVTLLHLDDKQACFLDNNFPGTWEWCSVEQFLPTVASGGGNYWAVIFLNPGPPPPPKA